MAQHKVMGICAGMHSGNGEIALKAALEVLRDKGAECELINLFDYNILPCTGCEGCTMQMGEIAQHPEKEYKGCRPAGQGRCRSPHRRDAHLQWFPHRCPDLRPDPELAL